MRGHFGHKHGHGPFGHHGPFRHHGPFGHHGDHRHFDHHGPFGAHGFYGQESGPGGPLGFCAHGGSGDCDPYRRPHGVSFGFMREGSPGPECGRRGRCNEDGQHRESDQERPCGRRGPHSPERHGHHGREDRGDHCRRRRPHDRSGDEEPSCCRRDRSGERAGPCRRGYRHKSPGHFGPFGHKGSFGCGPPKRSGPQGHGPHHGPFGPRGGPGFRCCCSNNRAQNSEDESGNETEGRHGRKNRRNCPRNTDDNRDTVLVQRIVVEKTPRCSSV